MYVSHRFQGRPPLSSHHLSRERTAHFVELPLPSAAGPSPAGRGWWPVLPGPSQGRPAVLRGSRACSPPSLWIQQAAVGWQQTAWGLDWLGAPPPTPRRSGPGRHPEVKSCVVSHSPNEGSSSRPRGPSTRAPWLALQLGSCRWERAPRPPGVPQPLSRVPTAMVLRSLNHPLWERPSAQVQRLGIGPGSPRPVRPQPCAPQPCPEPRQGACPRWVDHPSSQHNAAQA